VNHGQSEIRLVELGHVFSRQDRAGNLIPGYEEHEAMAMLLTGLDSDRHWAREPRPFDFHDIAGFVDAVLELLGVAGVRRESVESPEGIVDFGVTYRVGEDQIGFAGQLKKPIADDYDLSGPALFAELNWSRLLASTADVEERTYMPISRFPTVERDLAFLVDASEPAGPMLELIRAEAGPLLKDSGVFDIYEGDRIEAGRKSLAFFLRFGAERTLKDEEVDDRIAQIVSAVTRTFGADLRE
jgi:phenylalanyl-tRNA synthetase beta chain